MQDSHMLQNIIMKLDALEIWLLQVEIAAQGPA